MSFQMSFQMSLLDAIKTLNCSEIINNRNELLTLSINEQLELFKTAFAFKNYQKTKELLLIVDTYCPDIKYDLMHYAIDARDKVLFRLLYNDYGVMKDNLLINIL